MTESRQNELRYRTSNRTPLACASLGLWVKLAAGNQRRAEAAGDQRVGGWLENMVKNGSSADVVDVAEIQVLRFSAASLNCPHCGASQDGWLFDPRGKVHECADCGKSYRFPANARCHSNEGSENVMTAIRKRLMRAMRASKRDSQLQQTLDRVGKPYNVQVQICGSVSFASLVNMYDATVKFGHD